MKNEDNTNSKRYYIFKHNPKITDKETVRFRESTGCWLEDFNKAHLWADHDFVVKKAKELKAQLRGCEATKDFNVCIGQVKIEVNGMFVIEVV